ncbi:MAG: manganese efflux pump [Deltaproteobacteria bacterium]|nr:manganese efflux pump [Deltaproteobacteria bacterium]
MNPLVILGIAVGLSMDAFAVAIASSIALHPVTRRQVFRFGFHFGLFQALMPILGWLLGSTVACWVAAFDHWIAFGLLTYVGGKAIVEALRGRDDRARALDPTRGWSLIAYSVATSIDAFAVGLSFACLGIPVWYPAAVIGLTTGALTTLGMRIGSRLGARFGKRMEIAGGLVLIGIGVKILVDHLLG